MATTPNKEKADKPAPVIVVEDSVADTKPVPKPVTTTELPSGVKIEDY